MEIVPNCRVSRYWYLRFAKNAKVERSGAVQIKAVADDSSRLVIASS